MRRPAQNLIKRLKNHPYISGNSPSVNFFLFLFFISYFMVGADLCKEMAKEKDEIGFITAIIENSVHSDNSHVLRLLENISREEQVLPIIEFAVYSSEVALFPPARSPPEIPV